MSPAPSRYGAFISYSHRDGKLAQVLHRRLETYTLPRALRGPRADGRQRGERLGPVFRDRDELASSGSLSEAIQAALDASAALIVVCSPAAVASPWVGQEIAYFRRRHPQRPALAFVVAGDPGADPRREPQRAAFPLALLLTDPDDPSSAVGEPIAADARAEGDGFGQAFLKLLAGLLDLRYDQLRQRELRRRQRRWALLAAISASLTVVFAVLALQATLARNAARAAQARAELELTSERQTREFLLSVFRLADPDEARGSSVTVREVLDRAVLRIDHTEFARPAVRSRFLATMGQAYSSLGLTQRSVELLRHAIDAAGAGVLSDEARAQRADSRLELADLLYTMGDYDGARGQLDALQTDGVALTWQQRARRDNVRGDVLAYTDQGAAARNAYQAALTAVDRSGATSSEAVLARARSFSGLALADQFDGAYAACETGYRRVVELLRGAVEERHPDSIAARTSLGACAYQNGHLDAARADWRSALAAAQAVYDPGSPVIAAIENNLGRLLLETGDLAGAEPMLRDALASDRRHMAADFDDLAYPLYNLGYVRYAQGDGDEAARLWQEALPIAEKNQHRMYGPLLSALADLRCAAGDVEAGRDLAERAVTVNVQHADTAPWYAAQARLTRRYCGGDTGSSAMAVAPTADVAVLRAKWGDESPFVRRAREQMRRPAASAK